MRTKIFIDGPNGPPEWDCTESYDFMESCNYGLIVVDDKSVTDEGYKIIHFVGYPNKPDDYDIKCLYEELRTDKRFNIPKSGWTIRHCPPDVWEDLVMESLEHADFER